MFRFSRRIAVDFEPHQLVKYIELTTEADYCLRDAETHVQS